MNRAYKKIRLKSLKYHDYSGVVCGYTEDKFILATTDKTEKSFRKLDKRDSTFIEEAYRELPYRYVYCQESDVYKQHPKLRDAII
jgi:hypothetical protein